MQQTGILSEFEKFKKDMEAQNKDNKTFADLNEANDFYNKMLANGTFKKRGYTLRGIDDYVLNNVKCNR